MSAIAGQVAWVTGGGSGIGLAGATELAKAGCKVIISGRDAAKLEAAAKQAGAHGDVSAIPLDVADRDAVKATADKILSKHGSVDVLVNSAGVNFPKRFWKETDPETFDKVFAINLHGAMYTTMAVLHAMRAKGSGTVINIASFSGWYPSYLTGPAYISSKAALMALTHSFNIEECVAGLRATVICPGEVATPILEKRPVPPSMQERARMLQEEDLGAAIRFVAELPARACVNELVISPTWNRIYIGGEDFKRK
jgi:NAD(P)-dependent dehydrogenase (short-subunit alcohol dehydrogenase family)